MKPRKPLKRTPLARGDKPLERKTPLARTWFKSSSGNLNQRAPRSGPVKARKSAKPGESALERDARKGTRKRSRGICECCGKRRACEWHHRRNRSQGGEWSLANGVDLCTQCHQWIGEHPAESYRLGWLVPNGVKPEDWPVERRPKQWEQPGVEWTPASPHPRQTEEAVA